MAPSGRGVDKMAEMLECRLLCERALGAEERDLEARFKRQARRHDLAEQARDGLIRQRSGVARQRLVQHLGFALRAVEVILPRTLLDLGDVERQLRAPLNQRLELFVQGVDLGTQFTQLRFVAHGLSPGVS